MRIVLLGAPGAGKGTQAAILADSLNIPHISTGDLFRENISAKTELGKEAKDYIDAGKLVPSDVTGRMVEDRLAEDDTQNGFLLDGFPRSVEQAKMLESMLSKKDETLDAVVNYKVNEDVVVERMLARGRADDNEDTIRTRMGVYYDQTAPLIDYYADKVININAEGTVEEISSETLEELDR